MDFTFAARVKKIPHARRRVHLLGPPVWAIRVMLKASSSGIIGIMERIKLDFLNKRYKNKPV